MAEVFKKRIIKFLKHSDYSPLKFAKLADALGVGSEDYHHFKSAFDQLRDSGQVCIVRGGLVTLPARPSQLTGIFKANPKGFGFVTPLEANLHGDLFIAPDVVAGAMTGDIVAVKVVKDKKRKRGRSGAKEESRHTGRIVEVLERAQNKFVGTLIKSPAGWQVRPDGSAFVEPISVSDVSAKGAHSKDKVVVEIVSWPTEKYLSQGVITEVLGKAGRYESETASVIRQYHLPSGFDESCLQQSRDAASEFDSERFYDRDDITDKVVITIDPRDSKDFDDGISIEKDSCGNCVLGVHIADVSFFVPPDSALDKEARNRGNSVYLPGKTIPMLPEILSNGICSLQPERKRFCKSVFLSYDKNGNVLSRRFSNSVIRSSQRLTYVQADKALKGRTKTAKPQVVQVLRKMEQLSRTIEKRRIKNGMLRLNMPETELVMDKTGRLRDVRPADVSYPHTMIEMFMVEANEAVASILNKIKFPLMRRIHPDPHSLSMQELSKVVKTLGFHLPKVPGRFDIQKLLEAAEGSECCFAVNLLVLRSLEKAQYSPLHIGHFALGSTDYCHFTSPIRRYADLLVHRVLESYLQKESYYSDTGQDLSEIGNHITYTEQRAEDAERELKTVLILQMLSNHIGEELDCIVSGLTGFGVFAQSRKFGIEGLISMDELGADFWKYNQKTQCIIGQRSGRSIRLGQFIRVRILSVNVSARHLDFVPVEPLAKRVSKISKAGNKSPSKKPRKSKRPRRKRK